MTDAELIREAADAFEHGFNESPMPAKLRALADRMEREINAHKYQAKALNHVAISEPTPTVSAEERAGGASLGECVDGAADEPKSDWHSDVYHAAKRLSDLLSCIPIGHSIDHPITHADTGEVEALAAQNERFADEIVALTGEVERLKAERDALQRRVDALVDGGALAFDTGKAALAQLSAIKQATQKITLTGGQGGFYELCPKQWQHLLNTINQPCCDDICDRCQTPAPKETQEQIDAAIKKSRAEQHWRFKTYTKPAGRTE